MAGELVILDGSSFFVTEPNGDVEASGTDGFFHEDVRHLSRWQLRIDGQRLVAIAGRAVDYYSARVDALLPDEVRSAPPLAIRRDRFLSDSLHEDIVLANVGDRRASWQVELRFGADFADLQALQRDNPAPPRVRGRRSGAEVRLRHDGPGPPRETRLRFSRPGTLTPGRVRFEVTLEPGASWSVCADLTIVVGESSRRPLLRCGSFGRPLHDMPMGVSEWMSRAAHVDTDCDPLRHALRQGLLDLASLRLRPREDLTWSVPAAGRPWFMALFGRDTIWAALQALPFHSELAQATLRALAAYQATEDDAHRDAEPGKILHELRRGTLAETGRLPHNPYYGSHDSTPLFLILLAEYERWTADTGLVRELEPAARAALDWIERFGDLDGDGFLEYRRRSPKGLANQCWKDSDTSIRFADGRTATGPIATCEIQAYAYAARLGLARLARDVYGDRALARRLTGDARRLKRRFNDRFWSPSRRHFVLALDGDKHQVDAMTSNTGHLLYMGIADDDKAELTATRLIASDMFTGWGIRTMSSLDAAYNPLDYHNGSVWPFDTAIAAEGLRRSGHLEQSAALALGLIDAARAFGYTLPELFSGFQRDAADTPAPYPL
ncbi:MAG: amylo-alpha-1,6-glucosidase, partial [Gaiellales bacterium]